MDIMNKLNILKDINIVLVFGMCLLQILIIKICLYIIDAIKSYKHKINQYDT